MHDDPPPKDNTTNNNPENGPPTGDGRSNGTAARFQQSGNNSGQPTNTEGDSARINACPSHIPLFWSEHPELWLHQLEAQFELARPRINELTKFRWVVSYLGPRYAAAEAIDLISSAPAENPYSDLRTAAISR